MEKVLTSLENEINKQKKTQTNKLTIMTQLIMRNATYKTQVIGGTSFSLYTVSYSYSPNMPIVVFKNDRPNVEKGT